MQKIIHVKCPKCNNNQHFHKFGKDKFGNQKYRCLDCGYQFAPDFQPKTRMRKYPPCPVCGKSSFLHHDYRDYSNYRCCDKKCNHSFFAPKPTAALPTSVSALFGKTDLKRMRHSPFLIITVLYQFFIGKYLFIPSGFPAVVNYLLPLLMSDAVITQICFSYAQWYPPPTHAFISIPTLVSHSFGSSCK